MKKILSYDLSGNSITHLMQYDLNQKIYLKVDKVFSDKKPEARFSFTGSKYSYYCNGDAVSVSDNTVIVTIPNNMLLEATKLYVYLTYNGFDDLQTTEYYTVIPVRPRPEPTGFTYVSNFDIVQKSDSPKNIYVQIFDYDGKVIKSGFYSEGDRVIFSAPLDKYSISPKMRFQQWVSVADIDNKFAISTGLTVGKVDIMVGAICETESGATEFDVDINSTTCSSKQFTLNNLHGSTEVYDKDTSISLIDWGDGNTSDGINNVFDYTHQYSEYGKYTIKVYGLVCEADISSSSCDISVNRNCITAIRFSNREKDKYDTYNIGNYQKGQYAFSGCKNLEYVSISKNVNNIFAFAFQGCSSLKHISLPSNISGGGSSIFSGCSELKTVVLDSDSNFKSGVFFGCSELSVIILNKLFLESLKTEFGSCSNLEKIYLYSFSNPSNIFTNMSYFPSLPEKTKIYVSKILYDTIKDLSSWESLLNRIIVVE